MKLFEWFKKFKYKAVAIVPWSIQWVDEGGLPIPGDKDTGYWIMMENGFGKRKYTCTNSTRSALNRVPGYKLMVVWKMSGVPPANAQFLTDNPNTVEGD